VGVRTKVRLNIGGGVSAGDATYMQSWYGVTETTAHRTCTPVYLPGAGLIDVNLGGNLRWELDDPRVVFGGGGLSHLLGPARSSPLTERPGGWSLNVGLSRHFHF
jgi:outer membrane protein